MVGCQGPSGAVASCNHGNRFPWCVCGAAYERWAGGVLTVHGGGSEAAFLFFHLFGESPAFISCPAEKVLM